MITLLVFSCDNDDDLSPVCAEATNMSSNSITHNSATITWETANTTSEHSLEYGISGFALSNGTSVSVSNTNTELTNLQANTSYDVYIKTNCGTGNNSNYTDAFSFTTSASNVAVEFKTNLSEMNLFLGDLSELNVTSNAFEYDLNTTLFSDYSHKQRIIALPSGTSMEFDGNGSPIFPDNTVIAKTFYYNNDERDLSLGKTIIETRVLIKTNGSWETGNYKWNEDQTDGVLDFNASPIPITWIDIDGQTNSVNYKIPSNSQCFTCHRTDSEKKPIGFKLRGLNFERNGVNQLQELIDNQLIVGLNDITIVRTLPKWDDSINYSLEERARAYMDVNCAHCHIEGGYCDLQSILRLDYETPFSDTNILSQKNSIINRISSDFQVGLTMPWIGTTILHDEGVDLMLEYLNSL